MGTQNELAERYGPQTTQIEALLDRARNLTDKEAQELQAAWDADRNAWYSARAARGAAWAAARDAAWDAAEDAQYAAESAAWAARYAWDAVLALVVRDLIGQNGFTQKHYDTLVAPWETVMGTEWTRETL